MNDEIRSLYAAVGRGETVQCRYRRLTEWEDWPRDEKLIGVIPLGNETYQWRIKPKTRTVEISLDGLGIESYDHSVVLSFDDDAARDALLKALRGL